ncbi:MAG: hypothetical protein IJ374_01115 [Lachnospiraceae bacterium]|nr:hypothetical protein [Lachnospiraceae bacterium]
MLYKNTLTSRYLSEQQLRDTVSLHTGSGVDTLFAMVKLGFGIYFRSYWLMAVAVYHMVLSAMHMMLLVNSRKKEKNEKLNRLKQLKSYRLCGIMMVFLNIAMSGMLVQMIWQGQRVEYPGFLVYAFAAYAFYCLIMAVVKVIKYWKVENPIFSASKSIRMAKALMSLFTLQTALLAQFNTEGEEAFEMLMNTLTGGSVCVLVLIMAVLMVRKANGEIEKLKQGVI